MFYNTTFPACYVLLKLKIPWKHALINVKFSPLFTGYTYVCVAALESHENQCQTQPSHHVVQWQRRLQSFTNGRRAGYVTSVRRPYTHVLGSKNGFIGKTHFLFFFSCNRN